MTRPMLAESIIRREREVHGELKVLAVSKEVHDLLTDDRTTVAAFFAANKERREALVDIIRRYE